MRLFCVSDGAWQHGMRRKILFGIPRVSDTLNGMVAVSRRAGVFRPLSLSEKGKQTKALFALGVVCLFWGTTWVASKQGVRYMPALQMAGIRQTVGGLFYVLFFLYKKVPFPKGKEWRAIVVLSVLNFVLTNGLSTWGVKYISAGLGSIIGAIFPLWLVLIGLYQRKKIKQSTVVGLAIGFAGICVVFYEHLQDFFNADFRFGIMISLVATWSWAFGVIYTKEHALRFNPYFGLGLQMIIAGPILLLVSFFTHQSLPVVSIPWQSWAAIGYLAVFGSVLSFLAYLYALQHLPTEQASLYAYINPLVAYLISAVFFDEEITLMLGVGVLITLYGVFKVNRSVRR